MLIYKPPTHTVRINFHDPTYTPPSDNIQINITNGNYVTVNVLDLNTTGKVPQDIEVIPGSMIVNFNHVDITTTDHPYIIVPGASSYKAKHISTSLHTVNIYISKYFDVLVHDAFVDIIPIAISAGPISFSVDVIQSITSTLPFIITEPVIMKSINTSLDIENIGIIPGAIDVHMEIIDGAVFSEELSRVAIYDKGSGNVEFNAYYAEINSDDPIYNGGKKSNIRIKNIHSNLFPYIPESQRIHSNTMYRKMFWKNTLSTRAHLLNAVTYLRDDHNSDVVMSMYSARLLDVQSNASLSNRCYSSSILQDDLNPGDTSFEVICKDNILPIFKNNDTIIFINNNYSTISREITVNYKNDNTYGITLSKPLKVKYNQGDIICSCIQLPILAGYTTVVKPTGVGSYLYLDYKIQVYSIGCIDESWTIIFTSDTDFVCYGNSIGQITSGSILQDYAPVNIINSNIYFHLDRRGWRNTKKDDIYKFNTVTASCAVWLKRYVPANSTTYLNNFSCVIQGET